ncbi:hypothetical protein PCYB_003500 [Plasmodium cynomolgi strain B]|uniref:CYIR protein n=1 Tax=Plasmodium cynomolgi (strain B) TaxID=1120755 RepID=K6UF73_PLACD|nr:hypothetical protein PCYB_003500 [Plasmodium cynomolgi strain B]GAB69601.1 hypothetical protein PCYB_003500 [Plasmodium cynomolgi strain B]
MNDKERYKSCVKTEVYFKSIHDTKNKETLKNIGCSVERGYRYLTALYDKTITNDLCEYLNLWLDEQKIKHVNDVFGITRDEWKNIEQLWNILIDKQDLNQKCERKHEEKDISEYQKRKNLMTYCIYRDYIKSLCEQSINSGIQHTHVCYAFNGFIKKHYETFYNEVQCIHNSVETKDYSYHISDDCTLYNIAKTFPGITEQDKKNVYADVSGKPIEKCKDTKKVANVKTELADSHTRSENNPLGATGLNNSSLTVVNSPDNKPLKSVYYAGLSVLGVVFTSMVLYKVKEL